MRVMSLQEGADRSGQHLRTFQRQIAEGKGPPIVEISERRRGILESDFEAWLLSRRRPVLEPPALRRGRGRPRKLDHSKPEALMPPPTGAPPDARRTGPDGAGHGNVKVNKERSAALDHGSES